MQQDCQLAQKTQSGEKRARPDRINVSFICLTEAAMPLSWPDDGVTSLSVSITSPFRVVMFRQQVFLSVRIAARTVSQV